MNKRKWTITNDGFRINVLVTGEHELDIPDYVRKGVSFIDAIIEVYKDSVPNDVIEIRLIGNRGFFF